LKSSGAKILILSNSGRRSEPNIERLTRLGLPATLYDDILSSGEVAHRMLRDRRLAGFSGLSRCLLLSSGGDRSIVDGLGLDLVDVDEADFILLSGSDVPKTPLADYEKLLKSACARGLPLLCANPDQTMITSEGLCPGPGHLARQYQDWGGQVTWVGKPYPAIYEFALSLFREIERRNVVAIGDSVEHDIVGAKQMGVASVLVQGGILAEASADLLPDIFADHGAAPDWIIPSLSW
jgi:HAD superfamily hydrolase (TIGR01459 family)